MNSRRGVSAGFQLELDMPALPLNDEEWSDREIYGFLDGYLLDQLKLLADDRTSEETRQQILGWVAAPIVEAEAAIKRAFSFQACCYAYGVDPEEMRERILRIRAPELLAQEDE